METEAKSSPLNMTRCPKTKISETHSQPPPASLKFNQKHWLQSHKLREFPKGSESGPLKAPYTFWVGKTPYKSRWGIPEEFKLTGEILLKSSSG